MIEVDNPHHTPSSVSRKWTEAKALAMTFMMATLGGGMGAFLIQRHQNPIPAPKLLAFAPEKATGNDVSKGRSFTLVEFLDYQCSPCRMQREKVQDIVNLYGGKVQLVVRHLPLRMHANAASAAAAAEAAREQGKFWLMHEALLKGGALEPPEIKLLAHKVGLNEKHFLSAWQGNAKERVAFDRRAAEAMGIDSTPSFLLCTPQGQVWYLSDLNQVHDLVR